MKKKEKHLPLMGLFLILILICMGSSGAESLRKVTPQEIFEYLTGIQKNYTFPVTGWKFNRTDDPEFSQPDLDDSQWYAVEVNNPLTDQPAMKKMLPGNTPFCWYRKDFTLRKEDAAGSFVLIPGRISEGDEVYLNGKLCGSHAMKEMNPYSSGYDQAYYIADGEKILKPGRNVLAIRVKLGFMGGMFSGIPELRKIREPAVISRMIHHSPGRIAVFRHIARNAEINRFRPGERIFIRPEMAALTKQKNIKGILGIRVLDSQGKLIQTTDQKLVIRAACWTPSVPMEINNPGRGEYTVRMTFQGDAGTILDQELKFSVHERVPFGLPQEKLKSAELPLTVDDKSYGTFGPRIVDKNKRIVDNWKIQDSRGTLEFLIGFNRKYSGPMLLMSNLRPMPVPLETSLFSHTIGGQQGHFNNMWMLGTIQADGKTAPEVSTGKTHWTGKTVIWSFPDGRQFDLTLSQLSPAVTVRAEGVPALNFFCQDPRFKLGAPPHIYIPQGDNLTEWKQGTALPENWLLVSWGGAKAWNEFDIPVLMVLERQPASIRLTGQSLRIEFRENRSGAIRLMPLYGMRLLPQDGLPADALSRSRRWSRILPGLPEEVTRTADIDYQADSMLFRDQFVWKTVKDDWNTSVEKYAPVPPVIMLAERGGMNLVADGKVEDLELSTLSGPFCAVKDAGHITYAMKGYSHLVRQVRNVTGIPDNAAVRKHRKKLVDAVENLLKNTISVHPWRQLVYHPKGKVAFGSLQPDFSNLLLALPYVPADVAEKVKKEVLTEVKNSFFNDDLVVRDKEGNTRPHNIKITSSLSGLEFTALSRHARHNGIDCPCWEALRLYVYYDAARTCNALDILRDNWKQIRRSYDFIVNSHDWAHCISWDSYAGIRVGNGFQENTIFHGALIAYARMAHALGKETESRQAAYYALMQLIGTKCCASASTNDYLRAERTVLAAHSWYDDMENLERKCPYHLLEFNERKGFCLFVMSPRTGYFATNYIMTHLPEIMRPFRDVWGDFSTRQMNYRLGEGVTASHLRPPRVDHFLYLTDSPPFPVEKLSQLREQDRERRWGARQDLPARQRCWWEIIGDERAALEAYGKLEYIDLW